MNHYNHFLNESEQFINGKSEGKNLYNLIVSFTEESEHEILEFSVNFLTFVGGEAQKLKSIFFSLSCGWTRIYLNFLLCTESEKFAH